MGCTNSKETIEVNNNNNNNNKDNRPQEINENKIKTQSNNNESNENKKKLEEKDKENNNNNNNNNNNKQEQIIKEEVIITPVVPISTETVPITTTSTQAIERNEIVSNNVTNDNTQVEAVSIPQTESQHNEEVQSEQPSVNQIETEEQEQVITVESTVVPMAEPESTNIVESTTEQNIVQESAVITQSETLVVENITPIETSSEPIVSNDELVVNESHPEPESQQVSEVVVNEPEPEIIPPSEQIANENQTIVTSEHDTQPIINEPEAEPEKVVDSITESDASQTDNTPTPEIEPQPEFVISQSEQESTTVVIESSQQIPVEPEPVVTPESIELTQVKTVESEEITISDMQPIVNELQSETLVVENITPIETSSEPIVSNDELVVNESHPEPESQQVSEVVVNEPELIDESHTEHDSSVNQLESQTKPITIEVTTEPIVTSQNEPVVAAQSQPEPVQEQTIILESAQSLQKEPEQPSVSVETSNNQPESQSSTQSNDSVKDSTTDLSHKHSIEHKPASAPLPPRPAQSNPQSPSPSSPVENLQVPAIKTGLLTKQGHFVKNWKRRFFSLEAGILRYFLTATMKDLKGELPLKNMTVTQTENRFILQAQEGAVFGEGESKPSELLMESPTLEDATAWVNALNEHIQYANKSARIFRTRRVGSFWGKSTKSGEFSSEAGDDNQSDDEQSVISTNQPFQQSSPSPNSPVRPQLVPSVHTGWLTKQGHFVKNWKRRFFSLEAGILRYFLTATMKDLKGELPLKNMTVTQTENRFILQAQEGAVFGEGESKPSELLMESPTLEDATAWVNALNEHIQYANKSNLNTATIKRQGSIWGGGSLDG